MVGIIIIVADLKGYFIQFLFAWASLTVADKYDACMHGAHFGIT